MFSKNKISVYFVTISIRAKGVARFENQSEREKKRHLAWHPMYF